jgi:hypothetical protein
MLLAASGRASNLAIDVAAKVIDRGIGLARRRGQDPRPVMSIRGPHHPLRDHDMIGAPFSLRVQQLMRSTAPAAADA